MSVPIPMYRTLDSYGANARRVEVKHSVLRAYLCSDDMYVFYDAFDEEIEGLVSRARRNGYRVYAYSIATRIGVSRLRELEKLANESDPQCIELTKDLLEATLIG